MCNVSVKDRLSSKELRKILHLDSIGSCMQNRRLRWFGHVERMDKNAWASRCRTIKVTGTTGRGRLKKTWEEVIRNDLKQKGVSRDLVKDRITWKSIQGTIQHMLACKRDAKPHTMIMMMSAAHMLAGFNGV